MIKLLGFLNGKNVITIITSIVIALAVFQLDSWFRVNPKIKDISKLQKEVLGYIKEDSIQESKLSILRSEKDTLDVLYDNMTFEYQNTIKSLTAKSNKYENKSKSLEIVIEDYESSGVCRDRVDFTIGSWPKRKRGYTFQPVACKDTVWVD
jgi:hypothetical protein